MNNVRNNVRDLMRTGQQGKSGPLANSVTIEVRKNGVVVNRMDLPAEEPVPVFLFVQQALAACALAAAEHPRKRLLLGVTARWKAWIIQHILRAV